MKSVLCLLSPLFFVTGCFLSQEAPPQPQVGTNPYVTTGVVTVEDVLVSNQGGLALLSGAFRHTEAATEASNRRLRALGELESRPATQCETFEGSARGKATPRASDYVSIGDVVFGPAFQSSMKAVKRDADNRYSLALEHGLPAGYYELAATGEGRVGKIRELLSMPEALEHVRVNGDEFGDPGMRLLLSEDLKITWSAPTVEHEFNRLLLSLVLEDGREVLCVAMEDTISEASAVKTWTIPKTYFANFPADSEATFYLMRVHRFLSGTEGTKIVIQGSRTHYGSIPIEP